MRRRLTATLAVLTAACVYTACSGRVTSPPSPVTPTPAAAANLTIASLSVTPELASGGRRLYHVRATLREIGGAAATITAADLTLMAGSTPVAALHVDNPASGASNVCPAHGTLDTRQLTMTDDDASHPRFIETLQRRGYRFLAQIDRAPDPIASSEKVVLAVVPFENLSGDPEQEYFSDGLTDEMITQLARLNPARLGVIGRTSAMKYKKSGRTITEIGRELGAAYVLEGSVRRAAGRVRITSRLVEVANQTHVWTQTYDRDFDDILTLQSEIARAIAREIDIQLAPDEAARLARPRGLSAEAHEAYLKGRYFWNKRTADAFKKGIEYFTRAIEHEPNYAAAYDGLCDSYVMLACRGVLPVTETFTKAKGAAQHALTIDPELGEARASLAHVRLHSWEWEGLDAEFRRALELNPAYAMAHYWYSEYLMAIGRPEDAVSMVRTALSLDPLSSVLHASVGMTLYLARRVSESMEALRKGLEIDPGHFLLRFRLGLVASVNWLILPRGSVPRCSPHV